MLCCNGQNHEKMVKITERFVFNGEGGGFEEVNQISKIIVKYFLSHYGHIKLIEVTDIVRLNGKIVFWRDIGRNIFHYTTNLLAENGKEIVFQRNNLVLDF